jgi:excisionase family DNA binding protein
MRIKRALKQAEATALDALLTRSDVARLLGVSPTTVTRWAREGRIGSHVTLGGHHRFERSVIDEARARMSGREAAAVVSVGRGRP